ncbi:MAG: molybdate ABC transporter substrate-binding protein [Deltaproteobacteria bacterium]|nr:molybdate ABC transporter substrate-binding protein [Deltaproteobacteria bacterium]
MSRFLRNLIVAGLSFFLIIFLVKPGFSKGNIQTLMVYSGAGMRKPMDEIASLFKKKYGIEIQYNYAGSNALLSQMELTRKGDVYMPGETYYIEIAEEKGLIGYKQPVAYHIPVITVPKGNPAKIKTIKDLARPGVKLVWGDPKAAAIGRLANKILEKNGIKDQVWKNIVATVPTMNELIVYIAMKQADASINWGDVVISVEDIEIVKIPKTENLIKIIPIGVLKFSKDQEIAKKFVDFCASAEGKSVFDKYGFPKYPNPEYE